MNGISSYDSNKFPLRLCYEIEKIIWNDILRGKNLRFYSKNKIGINRYEFCITQLDFFRLGGSISGQLKSMGVIGDFINYSDSINFEGYFVLGDNRMYSVDSRDFGMVNKDEVLGTVLFRI